LPIFDLQKCYNPLSPPPPPRPYSTDLSPPNLFSVPQVENEVKRTPLWDVAEIQEAVTDELKKVQKEFSAAFQKLYDRAKACICANGAYFEQKNVSSIFKKLSPKIFGLHCVNK